MKKTTQSNPLKFFNDNKSMAYKKAGGQMSTYKVKLKKAQDGIETENDMMINKPGSTGGYKKTVVPKFWENDTNKYIKDVSFPNTPMLDSMYPKQKTTKGIVAGQEMEFTPEQMKSIFGIQKKGGSVKSKNK